jgi:hypothetical protein
MHHSQATDILDELAPEQRAALETAHDRYRCFARVSSFDAESDRQAEADRATYAHLLLPDKDGRPCVSQKRAADFMAAVTGMPAQWCVAWDEHAFHQLHGDDSEEGADANAGAEQ